MGKVRLYLAALLVPFIVATAVATVVLWPDQRRHAAPASLGVALPLENGVVTRVDSAPCIGDPAGAICDTITVRVTSGPDAGNPATFPIQQSVGAPDINVNDKLVLGRTTDVSGVSTYFFSDFQRETPLKWLGLAFAASVVLLGRWRGVGALVGLTFTWMVVTNFMLPSILEGRSPTVVAVTGAALIVFVVLYVAHGLNRRTTIALIGTLFGLALTGVLAHFSISIAHITGLSSEDVTSVQTYASQINVQGLLLAGIVIGSLGVLNDVTVTQSSAVWEVHQADRSLGRRALYRAGMRVGRDHVASTVYTLVLAYVGAALPLLIIFSIAGREWSDVAVTDVVGEEIVRSIAGALGLMCAVPITTALAALAADRAPVEGTEERDQDHHPVDPDEPREEEVAVSTEPEPAHEESEPLAHIASSSTILGDGVVDTGQVNLAAYPPKPTKRRFSLRRKSVEFDRKMSRREKRFWRED